MSFLNYDFLSGCQRQPQGLNHIPWDDETSVTQLYWFFNFKLGKCCCSSPLLKVAPGSHYQF